VTPGGGWQIPAALDASIVFLRHGESTFIAEGRFQGRTETPLTGLGEQQAALAAARLARPADPPVLPIPVNAPLEIAHSPLARAAATARIVAEAMTAAREGPPVVIRPEPRLVEIGQGEWEGLHRDEVEHRDAALLEAWRTRPMEANAPGGERLVEAAERADDALKTVLAGLVEAQPAGRRGPIAYVPGYASVTATDRPWTLLVAHDGVFKLALLALLGLPLEAFWIFPFALCGISVVEVRGGRAILRAHNLTEHLAPLERVAASGAAAATETPEERGGAL
jgi:phosphoserine phosphatase